jgi:predicted DNA-binding transcriptional regulator AlpA
MLLLSPGQVVSSDRLLDEPFHRLGGRLVRYATDDLDAWLEDQKVAPGA